MSAITISLETGPTSIRWKYSVKGGVIRLNHETDVPGVLQVGRRMQHLLHRSAARTGGTPGDLVELRELARQLSTIAVPGEIADQLARQPAAGVVFDPDQVLSTVPWELLDIRDDFLCLNRCVSFGSPKSIDRSSATRARASSIAVVCNPDFTLPGSLLESTRIQRILSGIQPPLDLHVKSNRVTQAEMKSLFSIADLLHFAGHARNSKALSKWVLLDGSFGPQQIAELASARVPQFIFANACTSGAEAPTIDGDSCRGLAIACLQRGVASFLGTIAPIIDTDGTRFAESFYRELSAGQSVGQSLLAARNEFSKSAGRQNLLWACYRLFGMSTTRPFLHPDRDVEPNGAQIQFASRSESYALSSFPRPCTICGKLIKTRHGIGADTPDGYSCRPCTRALRSRDSSELFSGHCSHVAEIIDAIRAQLSIASRLSASELAAELQVETSQVELAFELLCDENHFVVEHIEGDGAVLSRTSFE